MPFKQLLRRIIQSQMPTSEVQQKIIQQLSETELMMKAARKTHEVVQKVQSTIKSGQLPGAGAGAHGINKSQGSLHSSSSSSADDNTPLHHSQLTAEHAAHERMGVGSDLLQRLRNTREQLKSDAKADWEDIKGVFGRRK